MSVRKAGRLAAALPPEAAVHRGDTLDEKYLSTEARMLRHLFNLWVEEKCRMGTLDEYVEHETARQSREARMKAKAEMMLARQRAREGV